MILLLPELQVRQGEILELALSTATSVTDPEQRIFSDDVPDDQTTPYIYYEIDANEDAEFSDADSVATRFVVRSRAWGMTQNQAGEIAAEIVKQQTQSNSGSGYDAGSGLPIPSGGGTYMTEVIQVIPVSDTQNRQPKRFGFQVETAYIIEPTS